MSFELDPKKWRVARNCVKRRDKGKCRWCGKRGKDVHHIVKKSSRRGRNLAYTTSNLILLCKECHYKTYGKESQYEEFFTGLIKGQSIQVSSGHSRKPDHHRRNKVEYRDRPIKVKIKKQRTRKYKVKVKR